VVWPATFRVAALETVVLVVAALALRTIGMLVLSVLALLCTLLPTMADHDVAVTGSGVALLMFVAVVNILNALRRDRLGLGHTSAESVIGQVRRRVRVQSEVPPLPAGWRVDVQQRAADGAAIAGDFVSSRLHDSDAGPVLDLALVDVSGKGIEAGSRALLLSGAVGGLLGSVPADQFLSEVNSYLIRQRWGAGFATCVYVRLELDTGRFELRAAGHPPPVVRTAAGEWVECLTVGTLLGVIPTLSTVPYRGALSGGDALFLVTDGVIEDRVSPIEAGMQRLMDTADRRLRLRRVGPNGIDGLAAHLVDTVPSRADDDRAVVVLWRDEPTEAPGTATGERADLASA
jgi:hypothetical protein